jgi:RNA ligase (TIGR02306 family)
MSNFRVSKQKIALFTHPNADALMLGRVGSYQVVVQKGLYNDGDEVIFAPEKSVLTGQLKTEYEKYLSGSNKDRVKAVRLRGEISSGIIIPNSLVPNFDQIGLDEDVAELLGITKYEPPIPAQLAGKVRSFDMPFIGHHDCEHAGVYVNELIDGERVIITSKIHGSQFILAHNIETGETIVSSKGQLKKGLVLEDAEGNSYWEAAKNDNIVNKIKSNWSGNGIVQIFGEIIPIQSGYSYGQTKITSRIFDIRFNGDSIPYDVVPDDFKSIWVPVVFDGHLFLDKKEVIIYSDPEKGIHKTKIDFLLPKFIQELAEVKERISGKELHWEEGIVIRPYIDRKATDGTPLRLKVISKHYRETGEEIN